MAEQPLPDELAALGFEEARVVRLQPGDIIVLMTSKQIAADQAEVMHERLSALFEGHRVAILEDGLFLEVLREGASDKRVELEWTSPPGNELFHQIRKNIRIRGGSA